MLLFKSKAPLEKSLSMPDIENRLKKRERLIAYVWAHTRNSQPIG